MLTPCRGRTNLYCFRDLLALYEKISISPFSGTLGGKVEQEACPHSGGLMHNSGITCTVSLKSPASMDLVVDVGRRMDLGL